MPSKSKAKGNRFERELVKLAVECGLTAKRAYASNGQSLGKTDDVDLLIQGLPFQVKCRKKIGDLYKPNDNNFGQIFKEDRGEIYVMMKFEDFLKIMNRLDSYTLESFIKD